MLNISNTEALLRYFKYDHLPEPLQRVSEPFCLLAIQVANGSTSGPETTMGLRKLLEAKDCIVRAHLHERGGSQRGSVEGSVDSSGW